MGQVIVAVIGFILMAPGAAPIWHELAPTMPPDARGIFSCATAVFVCLAWVALA